MTRPFKRLFDAAAGLALGLTWKAMQLRESFDQAVWDHKRAEGLDRLGEKHEIANLAALRRAGETVEIARETVNGETLRLIYEAKPADDEFTVPGFALTIYKGTEPTSENRLADMQYQPAPLTGYCCWSTAGNTPEMDHLYDNITNRMIRNIAWFACYAPTGQQYNLPAPK